MRLFIESKFSEDRKWIHYLQWTLVGICIAWNSECITLYGICVSCIHWFEKCELSLGTWAGCTCTCIHLELMLIWVTVLLFQFRDILKLEEDIPHVREAAKVKWVSLENFQLCDLSVSILMMCENCQGLTREALSSKPCFPKGIYIHIPLGGPEAPQAVHEVCLIHCQPQVNKASETLCTSFSEHAISCIHLTWRSLYVSNVPLSNMQWDRLGNKI
jgi:hypothetical protein